MFNSRLEEKALNCSGIILGESDSPTNNNEVNVTGKTSERIWEGVDTHRFSSVVSKYNSGQDEKQGMVRCTCCSARVAGKIISWNVLREHREKYGKETVPQWKQCENCKKFLGHLEEENEIKLLGMCTDCFNERRGAL